MTTRYATTGLVAVGWLGALGLSAGYSLPEDPTTWPNGFITPFGSGGSSNIDVPLISPVLTLKCWATTPGTDAPPWNQAFSLAETVRTAGCFARGGMDTFLTLPDCDQQARVVSAYFAAEPRPSYADQGDYACVLVDMRLHWIVQGW